MLVIAEKPSVAKDFAIALGCTKNQDVYSNQSITIIHAKGHLFELEDAVYYDARYKSWDELPIIPQTFRYRRNPSVSALTTLVLTTLAKHRNDDILIATDADREGELIAREILLMAGITDFSRIKRFWVSQALTSDVITAGVQAAKPLSAYDNLASSGFARQRADWLVGINFTRYISTAANATLPIGRVQTALLSAIASRCSAIDKFTPTPYYEFHGVFSTAAAGAPLCHGVYYIDKNQTAFPDTSKESVLRSELHKAMEVKDNKVERKTQKAPELYNLTALQIDVFNRFGYSAAATLDIVQQLYETYKCCSYPRAPSRVMGSDNVDLCRTLFMKFATGPFQQLVATANLSTSNKHIFDDSRLEAHHAIIPLDEIPASATDAEKNVYTLIRNRFLIAFATEHIYDAQTVILSTPSGNLFKVTGKKTISEGWKVFEKNEAKKDDKEEDEQVFSDIPWDSLLLNDIVTKSKMTKPPKYFTEASLLAFMENPKNNQQSGKLDSLGTEATRSTYIPKLAKSEYITIDKKNILVTEKAKKLLTAVQASALASVADIAATTDWERRLSDNPTSFFEDIKQFVRTVCATPKPEINCVRESLGITCPKCGKEIRRGKSGWYCSGYKEGCDFKLWEMICGARLNNKDVAALCSGEQTAKKNCTSKAGKKFSCTFVLDQNFQTVFEFEKK